MQAIVVDNWLAVDVHDHTVIATGKELESEAVILELFARKGEEFMRLNNGNTLRLDQLVSVDGLRLADYC